MNIFSWKNAKLVVALVAAIVTVVWAVSSVQSRSYSGSALSVPLGTGAVTVTNPATSAVPVQFVSVGSRSFVIASKIDGFAGTSAKSAAATTPTQVLELSLPAGVSEFTMTRGNNVNFVSTTQLEVLVQPVDAGQARTSLIVAALVVAGLLYYMSSLTDHQWVDVIRGRRVQTPITVPMTPVVADGGQGETIRSYGDNRKDKTN